MSTFCIFATGMISSTNLLLWREIQKYPGEWWVSFTLICLMALLVGLTLIWARNNW